MDSRVFSIPQVFTTFIPSGFYHIFVLCFLLFCFSALSENCMTITSSRARNNIRSKKDEKSVFLRRNIGSSKGVSSIAQWEWYYVDVKNLNWALSCLCSIPPLSRVRSCDVHHSSYLLSHRNPLSLQFTI